MWLRGLIGLTLLAGVAVVVHGSAAVAHSAEPFRTDDGDEKLPWFELVPGEFPPPGSQHSLPGELIALDHIRRTGVLRQDRNGKQNSGEYDAPVPFAMLPYGTITYHGALAELRDIPIGTHLHGQFYLGPPPDGKGNKVFNQVLALEDDFSYAAARKRFWRIDSVAADQGAIVATGIGAAGAADAKPTNFQITRATRVWKGAGLGALSDLAPGQQVLLNLTVCTLKGPGRCTDIWMDDESRALATATQREIHLQYQREHGLAARIDAVDNQQGILRVTLFGGIDPSLTTNFKVDEYIGVAVADEALRTHDQVNDSKRAQILTAEQGPASPLDSGLRLTLKPELLLEGFRPKRIVRLWWGGWPIDDLPREERLYY